MIINNVRKTIFVVRWHDGYIIVLISNVIIKTNLTHNVIFVVGVLLIIIFPKLHAINTHIIDTVESSIVRI